MNILRTVIWVLTLIAFLIFSIYNWKPVELTLWQNLVMETKVPVLALLAFALGFVPLLTYHLSVKWGLNRRVRALENSLRTAALPRQNDTQTTAAVVNRPVDKPGTKPGDPADPLSPTDSDSDGGIR